jgi:hypothetical protein
MSAFASPIQLNNLGESHVLERVPLGHGGDSFSEKWVQEILFSHPECLPFKEIDPRINQLIPICMELETGAGPADILYVTEAGQLVLVETKLWRNPEARRMVVAQILDYAKQLTSWSFTDLLRETAVATKKSANYFLERVKQSIPDIDEASFVDSVSKGLQSGDFLLLIVGDGIRTGTESLVNFLDQYGHLRFGFGLIEVAAFKMPSGDLLLSPRVLAKTQILEKTILIGSTGTVSVEELVEAQDQELDERLVATRQWFQDFWSGYLKLLKLDDLNQPTPTKPANAANMFFSIRLHGRESSWISAYIAKSSSVGGVYLTFKKGFDQASEYFERLKNEKETIEKTIGAELEWSNEGGKIYISAPRVSYQNLNDAEERVRVQSYLADMSNRMVNAFRHRLEDYDREES